MRKGNWTPPDDFDFDALFQVTAEEAAGIYDRAVKAFNDACDKIDRQQDDAEIRRVLTAALGRGTYMIEGD